MFLKSVIILNLTVALLSFGCSKFRTTTVANLAPFADQTVVMLSDADYGLSGDKAILTKKYLDYDSPELKKLIALRDELLEIFGGMIDYSVNLVRISESKRKEKKKVSLYAQYLVSFRDTMVEKFGFSNEQFNDVLKDVRSKKRMLDALNAAQPLINQVSRYAYEIINKIQLAQIRLASSIELAIDSGYEQVLKFYESLENDKIRVVKILYILRYYEGNKNNAPVKLGETEIRKEEEIEISAPTSRKHLKRKESRLSKRLQEIETLREKIAPEINLYYETHKELDRILEKVLKNMSKARIATLMWSSAHHKMATGVTNPAEWFDLKNLPLNLLLQ